MDTSTEVAVPVAQGRTLVQALLVVSLGWACTLGAHAAAADDLRLGGTGGALANLQTLAAAFAEARPEVRVHIVPSLGSGGGIKALLAGKLEVAVSGRPLKDEERAQGVTAVEYARSALVFVANDPSVTEIGRADLLAIYRGEVSSWPDGKPIRIVLRLPTESDTLLLRGMSEDMNAALDRGYATPGVIQTQTDQENADVLETVPGAFGTITQGQVLAEKRSLRPLTLDGVAPTPAAVGAGGYPLVKSFYLVTMRDGSSLAAAFVAFVQSAQARPLLSQHGYVSSETPSGR